MYETYVSCSWNSAPKTKATALSLVQEPAVVSSSLLGTKNLMNSRLFPLKGTFNSGRWLKKIRERVPYWTSSRASAGPSCGMSSSWPRDAWDQ